MLRQIEERAANVLGRVGERLEFDGLVYSPLRMHLFHLDSKPYAAPFANSIVTTFPSVRTVADVGSGSGAYAAALNRAGVKTVACERSRVGRVFAKSQRVDCRGFDLTRDPPADLPADIELAYCVEVAEHLPAALGDRLVSFLCSVAPIVVFTAAPPGQGGTGHINEQKMVYWEQRFSTHNWLPDPERTTTLRDQLTATAPNVSVLVRNLAVFAAA